MSMLNYIAFEYRIEKMGSIKYYLTPKVDNDDTKDATHNVFTALSRATAVSPTSVVDSPNKYQFEDLSKELITIHVKTLKRGEFTIDVERSDTVDDVKTKIEDKEGIPHNRQHIIFARSRLTDGLTTISKYNIDEGSVLDLIIPGLIISCCCCQLHSSRVASTEISTTPDERQCFICLVDGLDEMEQPVVRNCSCSVAHLSCVVESAKKCSKRVLNTDLHEFSSPWMKCLNCKQIYQNDDISIYLSNAFLLFAEAEYGASRNNKWDVIRVMISIQTKVVVLTNVIEFMDIRSADLNPSILAAENVILIKKMLSMVNQMKEDLNMYEWVRMPRNSQEYELYKLVCEGFEAQGYLYYGKNTCLDVAIRKYAMARSIYKLLGNMENSKAMTTKIAVLRAEWAEKINKKEDECPNMIQPNDTLFVANFHEIKTTREDLQMLFESFGELMRIDMKRTYAFVQFKTVDQAIAARDATNGGQLDQCKITVDFVARANCTG